MTATVASETIRAAGCVVWRLSKKGNLKVLLIHRPRYDDWSFPKGKLDPTESFLEAALRETQEEVNVVGGLGPQLPPTLYRDNKGRLKIVRYWALEFKEGEFIANDEVDAIKWAKVEKARWRLTYGHDVSLLASLRDALEQSGALQSAGARQLSEAPEPSEASEPSEALAPSEAVEQSSARQ